MLFEYYLRNEKKISDYMKKWAPVFMRFSLGFIFLWFGFLKLIGASPIEELVKKTAFLIDEHSFVLILGIWEMVIGISFIIKRLNRLALILFFLQIPGTFIPLFTNPEDCFTVFPYALTLEGQYIFKNFILISGAFYVLSKIEYKS